MISVGLSQGCSSTKYFERSEHKVLYSPAMAKQMSYSVYTPPDWNMQESLPLVILLHGAKDDHRSFDKFGVGVFLDSLYSASEEQARKLPRAIIVNPQGDLGFWENWNDGTRLYRDWVVKDLIPHIQKQYNTASCPQHCHLTGVSMGAHGAMRFAYYEDYQFASVAAISAMIISKTHPPKNTWRMALVKWFLPLERIWGDVDAEVSKQPKNLDPYISWIQKPELQDVRLMLSWGDEDHKSIAESNEVFQSHLAEYKRPHQWWIYSGKHKWVDWRSIIAESLHFHIDGRASSANHLK